MHRLPLLLGITFAIIGAIVMLESAGTLSNVIGILFTLFGAIINLLQLYVPMPLSFKTSPSNTTLGSKVNRPQINLLQGISLHLPSPSFTSQPYLPTANVAFLWVCFTFIPLITLGKFHGGGLATDFMTVLLLFAMSGVGLFFLISCLRLEKNRSPEIVGGVLLTVSADMLFFLLLSDTHAFFYTHGSGNRYILDVFQLSGDLIFLMSTFTLILGGTFLIRSAKAGLRATWGATLTMIGVCLMFSSITFLSLWILLANVGTGLAIFLAPYRK